jgi:cytidine deaminase
MLVEYNNTFKLLKFVFFMREVPYSSLTDGWKSLLSEAERVMENAYNPYSRFYVGAALLARNGEIIGGTNVENAAYGSTICAERSAILRANAMKILSFDALAIIARGENFDTTEVTGPCGSCRQMIYESSQISEKDFEILMSTTRKDKIIIATIKELLPLGFGPADLGIDITRFQK